ncbi:MAG TPA: hypothetical protein VK203_30850 [Nostocaceae cyanobacterium]|nr:hypothetical protein [Nostocaceae cyanobacterium]
MRVTRDFVERWEISCHKNAHRSPQARSLNIANGAENPSNFHYLFVRRLLQQGKQLSQLIARSWLNDQLAQNLRTYFIETKGIYQGKELNDGRLRTLLSSNGEGNSNEAKIVRSIFLEGKQNEGGTKELLLPIFSPEEMEIYEFAVSWDTWYGEVVDIPNPYPNDPQNSRYFRLIIPYPPRPEVYDDSVPAPPGFYPVAPIKLSDLQNWVTSPIYNQNKELSANIFPPYPYIPGTCC